jgi:hypothetical protein
MCPTLFQPRDNREAIEPHGGPHRAYKITGSSAALDDVVVQQMAREHIENLGLHKRITPPLHENDWLRRVFSAS